MKVLIITYYWPPAGGSGVQRWLKFVKYLQDFGIAPVVYTVENANYEVEDVTLVNEIPKGITILKQPILEPNRFLKTDKVATSTVTNNPSFIQKTMQYIRGNYFIPDARKFWIKPSVNYLTKYLKEHPVDCIISTGPPHSMHLIAMQLKKQLGVKWIADFRDPMANLFYNETLNLSLKTQQKIKKLETTILKTADRVITVSNAIATEFQKYNVHVDVITNGYDDEVLQTNQSPLDTKFSLTHIGLIPTQSDPKILWNVLQEIILEHPYFANDLQIHLVGNVSETTLKNIESTGLNNYLKLTPYIAHKKAVTLQKQAQVLLLLVPQVKNAAGIVTGKIFEYLVSNRPILAIAPSKGDAAVILKNTNTGVAIDFNDAITLKKTILKYYQSYKEDTLTVKLMDVEKFHRKTLTKQLSKIIKATVL